MIVLVIPDQDLSNLSLWLVDLDAGPVFFSFSFLATISTIPQSELIIFFESFVERDQVVFIVKLVNSWEVFVLLVIDWHARIRVSPGEDLGKLVF